VVLKRKVKVVPSAITAFDIGPAGRTLALGTSEGDTIICSFQIFCIRCTVIPRLGVRPMRHAPHARAGNI
jgi:hypothetical protein